MAIRETLILTAILSWGCTPQAYRHELGEDHPASPAAPAGRPAEASATLTIGDDLPPPDQEDTTPHAVGSPHEMGHGDHRTKQTPPAGTRVGEALYRCPMHPETTSRDPERRCPKCSMKMNKPLGPQGSRPGHEGHGGHAR